MVCFVCCREVVEVANGSLPFLHLTSQCRCPPSHPSIFNDDTCSQHPMATISRGIVSRLNSFSKPVGYVNDQTSRNWVSSPGISNVQITINLTQSLYEVRAWPLYSIASQSHSNCLLAVVIPFVLTNSSVKV